MKVYRGATLFDKEVKLLVAHYRSKLAGVEADNGLDEADKKYQLSRYHNLLRYWELVLQDMMTL